MPMDSIRTILQLVYFRRFRSSLIYYLPLVFVESILSYYLLLGALSPLSFSASRVVEKNFEKDDESESDEPPSDEPEIEEEEEPEREEDEPEIVLTKPPPKPSK